MQVLLRRDVKGIGRRGDSVTVSSGHARNDLIPTGLAVEATDGAVEQAATVKKSRAVREAADRESARAIATAFAESPLIITAKAGATGKLFGSVTAADIVEAVERQFHVVVERKHVSIEHPIREVGTHQVSVA
ncbi:MAG: 50S ribosomal protein L9, partial [Actinomycetota bacterium]